MIKQIKDLRVKIDGLHQLTKDLKPLHIEDGNYKWDIELSDKENTDLSYFLTANSKEVNKAADSLLLAKAWLGKLLGELGSDNPYSTGKKTVEDIEPTADTHNKVNWNMDVSNQETKDANKWLDWNHIERVDWLRSEIQSVIDTNRDDTRYIDLRKYGSIEAAIARTNSYNHLCEAKMWLGFEFARIRDNEKSE